MHVLSGKCKFQKLTQEVENITMYLKKLLGTDDFMDGFQCLSSKVPS